MANHLVNPDLLSLVRQSLYKSAFVPAGEGGDPAAAAGGDPMAAGGAPPGGDPQAGGGGGAGIDPGMLQQMVQQQVQQQMMAGQQAGMGGAPGAGAPSGAPIKPKIDVNVELMQIKNMLAKICDHLQIPIPAQDMVATPDKLMAMSQGQSTASGAQVGGQGGAQQGGAIPPIDPMQGAGTPGMAGAGMAGPEKMGFHDNGTAFNVDGFSKTSSRASAIARLLKARR